MHVTQVKSEKLKREYSITVPSADIAEKIEARLKVIGKDAKLPGFRPGKIPPQILRKNYGQRVLGEVLDQVVSQSSQEAIAKQGERPALKPKIEIVGDFAEGKDLTYKMEYEVLPKAPEVKLADITLDRPKVTISDKEVAEALEKIATQSKDFAPVVRAAKAGDAVLIDFKGFMGDRPFEGGEAKGHQLELGSDAFIPGFEEGLIGAKPGEKRDVHVEFPKEYHAADLAGQKAKFEVTVHEVREAKASEITEDLAKKLGFDGLDKLREAVKAQMEGEVAGAVRTRLKKQLFDLLDEASPFNVPEVMVKMEFDSVWQQVQNARKSDPDSEDFKGKSDEDLQEEYQVIAERRVRLGILLADLGQKQKISVNQQELTQAILQEARRYPGQEREVFEYYQKHPEYIEMFRGPILEEKVVDFILENVTVKDREATLEELREPEEGAEKSEGASKGDKAKKGAKKQ